ncbi:hypothetical protein CROQUDRAFT_79419 [Cronartium quercuum f. sp. fusiforme G11]|uniref:Uncharacterized protein n=1 Tax=Cronartium quercuum f. sp. fusiforme G11 TaxID=708437 RepID=A0A9P6NG27_9BASI|nr:hypothetical protein CROQUDRAFT_79419 [Cronartium quercuum f. sp. fusiforme G11]
MESHETRRLPPLPSHSTKHLRQLDYVLSPLVYPTTGPSEAIQVTLLQNDACGTSTGATLWLGAQILSAYLLSESTNRPGNGRRYAIEIGAGTGLVSITLSALGYCVLATDIEPSMTDVLMPNMQSWMASSSQWSGPMCVCSLDWNCSIDWLSIRSCLHSVTQPGFVQDVVFNLNLNLNTNRIGESSPEEMTIEGPVEFDLIVTSDTVYTPELVEPLLKTLLELSGTSRRPPPIYLALERRDPTLVEDFLAKAKQSNFKTDRISHSTLVKITEKMSWKLDDWEGAEIWKLRKRTQILKFKQTFESSSKKIEIQ